ncbi:MAG: penicillin-binding protein activator [Syntrophobacterales bacterium]|nr:penicillin-binding protein activator [Syntrophobacterales bacterium]
MAPPPVVVQPQIQVEARRPAAPPAAAGEELFHQAEAAYRRQDYDQALRDYRTYLSRHPQGSQAFRARLREAEITGLVGDWGGAVSRYETLLAQNPDLDQSREIRYGLGRAYYKLGQYTRALQILEPLTAADLPVSLRFSTNALLAEIALKQGRVEAAFSRLRLAHQDLAAGDAEWFDFLKKRLLEQATPADLERLANLYRDTPVSAALLARLADHARRAGRIEEARRWLTLLSERYPGTPEAQAAGHLLTPARLRVGAVLPLTGELAETGQRLKQGLELALRGTPVEVVFQEAGGAGAAQAVSALARQPHLVAVAGFFSFTEAPEAARAAQEAGLPLLALTQRADVTEAGEWVFQAFLTPRRQVQELVRYGLARGWRRYALLAPDSTYGRTFSRLFAEELQRQGGQVAAQETYPPGTGDFAVALSPVLAHFSAPEEARPFDAWFVPDDAATLSALLSQVAEHPLRRLPLLGTNLAHPADAAQARRLEGLIFPEGFFPGDPDPAVKEFITAYQQRYGKAPDYFAAQGYLAGRLLAQLAAAGVAGREEAVQQLRSFRGGPPVPWFKGFNSARQAELTVYLLTIRDGRVVPAEGAP